MRRLALAALVLVAGVVLGMLTPKPPAKPKCFEVAKMDSTSGLIYVREERRDGTCHEYIIGPGMQIWTP